MEKLADYIDVGLKFHGHRCPAMPLGVRAGLAAMAALGVERAQDKELQLIAETGKGHAASCFLDGLMTATGCTYGKGNIQKTYFNKMAFTLIDSRTGHRVRVSLKPEFFQKSLNSPFVQQRKQGVAPQDIPAEIADPIIAKVLELPEEAFLDISEVTEQPVSKGKGIFTAEPCAKCGELTFVNKLRLGAEGEKLCIPCSGYDS